MPIGETLETACEVLYILLNNKLRIKSLFIFTFWTAAEKLHKKIKFSAKSWFIDLAILNLLAGILSFNFDAFCTFDHFCTLSLLLRDNYITESNYFAKIENSLILWFAISFNKYFHLFSMPFVLFGLLSAKNCASVILPIAIVAIYVIYRNAMGKTEINLKYFRHLLATLYTYLAAKIL